MGLNRIVTLFHAKSNTLGDTTVITVDRSSSGTGIRGGLASGTDSGSSDEQRHEEEGCDSSTTMSLSSSVESLTRSSSPAVVSLVKTLASGIIPPKSSPNPGMPVQVYRYDSSERRRRRLRMLRDVNNNNNSGSNTSLNVPLCANKVLSSAAKVGVECNGSFEDVLLVLGTAEGGGGNGQTLSPCPKKRNSALSRRFSLKAKFSSDLDLYGNRGQRGGGGGAMTTDAQDSKLASASSSSSLVQGAREHPKKSSIWSSFRLPVRSVKGNHMEHMVEVGRRLNVSEKDETDESCDTRRAHWECCA